MQSGTTNEKGEYYMRLGKMHFRQAIISNNMTGNTLAQFMEKHVIPVETVYVKDGIVIWGICQAFVDLDDECKKIPEYKVVFKREDNILGLQIEGIKNEGGEMILNNVEGIIQVNNITTAIRKST